MEILVLTSLCQEHECHGESDGAGHAGANAGSRCKVLQVWVFGLVGGLGGYNFDPGCGCDDDDVAIVLCGGVGLADGARGGG